MNAEAQIQAAPQLDSPPELSPLASARVQRKLTVDEAARRAGLTPDQVEWLEEGRVYRFPSSDDALAAAILYATALGIRHGEASEIAGISVPPLARYGRDRLIAAGATLAVLAALALAIALATGVRGGGKTRAHPLPPPWKIEVDVRNGSGDIYYTRGLASRIGALGYRIERVAKANRFDYPTTAVYYEPGGSAICGHLADQLHVALRPLPGGTNPRRCVVIAGPATVG